MVRGMNRIGNAVAEREIRNIEKRRNREMKRGIKDIIDGFDAIRIGAGERAFGMREVENGRRMNEAKGSLDRADVVPIEGIVRVG